MNEINDSAILAALRRQMATAVAKQSAAASNLANLDTPGYKAREVSFADALDELNANPLSTTDDLHIQTSTAAQPRTVEIEDLPLRRDGNNVQLDRELLALTRASGEFSAAQTALTAKFRLVRYAINEGR